MTAEAAATGETVEPAGAAAGRVVAVGHAPVKGTRHTPHRRARLEPGGVVGDRGLCLVDVERRHVLRTVQHPLLTAVVAERHDGRRPAATGDHLRVVLPDGRAADGPLAPTGEELTCEYWGRPAALRLLDGPHADLLGAHLGRPVRLAAAPPGAVVYAGPVTLVTTASLRALADALGVWPDELDAGRFRSSVVLDGPGAGEGSGEGAAPPFAEESWVGRELTVGEAVLRVRGPVPRCAVVDVDPGTGERDRPVLRALVGLAQRRGADGRDGPPFGVDADVLRAGDVAPGDPVRLLG